MKKLVSMTEFVLQLGETSTFDMDKGDWFYKETEKLDEIRAYAKFLKTPLTLGMFVPCDEDGNVLEEPLQEHYSDCTEEQNAKDWLYNIEKYQLAKDKVLFEWFFVHEGKDTMPSDVKSVTNGILNVFWFNNIEKWYLSRGISSIENLVTYNLTLTETAIKTLNL